MRKVRVGTVGTVGMAAARAKIGPDGRPCPRHGGVPLDANDSVEIGLDFVSGAFGHAQTTRWAAGRRNEVLLEVHGTRGALSVGHTFPEQPFLRICAGRALAKWEWKDLRVPPIAWTWQRFIRAIRAGEPQPPDILRGAEIQACLDACERSAAGGQFERVPRIGTR